MFQSNLYRLFVFILFYVPFLTSGQKKETSDKKLKMIGIVFNRAQQNNLLFKDRDYDYRTNTLKAQLFYLLRKGEKWDLNLIVQPQLQAAKHQLLNPSFMTPDIPNFEALRDRFTREKSIGLYMFELGFQWRTQLLKLLFFETTLGLGAGYIDKESERLAKGFTFIENLSIGVVYSFKSSELYLGSQAGHISNFDTQEPNDGYNIFGFEIGYRIALF